MKKYYKVVRPDMTATYAYGFKYEAGKTYSLPPEAKLELCESGFHVTDQPAYWYEPGYLVFPVTIPKGSDSTEYTEDGYKQAFRSIKLGKKPLTAEEMAEVGIGTGNLIVNSNNRYIKLYDSSQVTAYGSSQVTACDSSIITIPEHSSNSPTNIKLNDNSVLIDHKSQKITCANKDYKYE